MSDLKTANIKLRPCPFCGGEAAVVGTARKNSKFNGWKAFCYNCGVETLLHVDPERAAKDWNRRVSDGEM
jgi:Lar family restriction alleviation protein